MSPGITDGRDDTVNVAAVEIARLHAAVGSATSYSTGWTPAIVAGQEVASARAPSSAGVGGYAPPSGRAIQWSGRQTMRADPELAAIPDSTGHCRLAPASDIAGPARASARS
jgi:hypothetical protein